MMRVTHFTDLALIHSLDILPHGSCKGVMGTTPSTMSKEFFVFIGSCEEGELRHPEKMGGRGQREVPN